MQEEIIEEIRKEKEKVTKKYKQTSPELQFYEQFLKNKDFSNPITYTNIKIKDFIIAYVRSQIKTYSFEELQKIASYLRTFFDETSFENINHTRKTMYYLASPKVYPIIRRFLEEKNITKRNYFLYRLVEKNDFDETMMNGVETMVKQQDGKLMEFVHEFAKNNEIWNDTLIFAYGLKMISERKKQLEIDLMIANNKIPLTAFDKNKIIIDTLKKDFAIKKLESHCRKIIKYYKIIKQKEKNTQTAEKHIIDRYNRLINTIKRTSNQEEITDYEKFISAIPNQELRIKILKYIYEHNKIYYNRLNQEYQSLSQNSILKYQRLLEKYYLSKYLDSKKIAQHYTYNDLKYLLENINNMTITNPQTIKKIILNTSKEYINQINDLIAEEILSKKTIAMHPEILEQDKNLVQNIKININNLETKNTDYKIFSKDQYPLLITPKTLSINLQTLKSYQLQELLENATDYTFLETADLEEKINLVLELGLEKALESDLGLLSYEKSRLNRLKILEQLNIPVTNDQLRAVLNTDKFIVPTNKIESYIIEKKLEDSTLQQLHISKEDIKETPRTYIYQDIYFSKNKVKKRKESLLSQGITPTISQMLFPTRPILPSKIETIKKLTK